MKFLAGFMILAGVSVIGYAARSLSSDAVALAIGLLFGVLAGAPIVLMLLVAGQRQESQPSQTIYIVTSDRQYQRMALSGIHDRVAGQCAIVAYGPGSEVNYVE